MYKRQAELLVVAVGPVATTAPEVQPARARAIAAIRLAADRRPVSMAAPSVWGQGDGCIIS